ncbi:MAG: PQQ-binding-like beta-propeller repeat protein [Spirochaetes bacterium]|nr:PQQ-binding-like beta-propeller repeat protein [Spirochaetota bacterium]
MKQNNIYSSGDLLKYFFGLFSKKKRARIKEYLEHGKGRNQEITKAVNIKNAIDNEPIPEYKEDLNIIIKKALKLKERKKQEDPFQKWLQFIRENVIIPLSYKWKYAAAVMGIIILGIILFLPQPKPEVYVTGANGDLMIDDQDFFSGKRSKFSLKRGIRIQTGDGKISFQIRDKKIILMQKESDCTLTREEGTLHLKLVKGSIFCNIKRSQDAAVLLVHAGEIQFKITGTKFTLTREKTENIVTMELLEGRVEAQFRDKSYTITDRSLFQIKGTQILRRDLNKMELKKFRSFNEVQFISGLHNSKGLFIETDPSDSTVFNKGKAVGKTPYFMAEDIKKEYDLFVFKNGYLAEEIDIKNIKQKGLQMKLKKRSEPELLWKYRSPVPATANPLKVDSFLIIPGEDNIVYKFSLTAKKMTWGFHVKDKVTIKPCFYKDTLYISSSDGSLYAVDFKTGRLIWQKQVGKLVYSEIVVYEQNLYLATGKGIIYCMDKKNGNIMWHKEFPNAFYSPFIINNDTIYIGNIDGYLYAINIRNRKIKWKIQTQAEIVSSKPFIKDDLIFFTSNDGIVYAVEHRSGRLRWKYRTGSSLFTSPIYLDGLVIITANNGLIHALQSSTGTLKWKYNTGEDILSNPVIFNNRYIFAGDKNNTLYILNKYGILFSRYGQAFKYYILYDKNVIMFGRDNIVYNFQLIQKAD